MGGGETSLRWQDRSPGRPDGSLGAKGTWQQACLRLRRRRLMSNFGQESPASWLLASGINLEGLAQASAASDGAPLLRRVSPARPKPPLAHTS